MTKEYKKAGVDIDAGNTFVERIRPLVQSTQRRGVIGGIGGFGGLFSLAGMELKDPVLVAGTDGVGTKLKLAIETGNLDTIGIDLVAMCVNDIACSGAEPLFFLDYFATSSLDPEGHTKIIAGIARACRETRCAILGGETAEMPDFYARGDFDLAGFAVGIVEHSKIIDGSDIRAGDSVIGLASSGPHSNGYSLIRRIIRDSGLDLKRTYEGFTRPLGEVLLDPTILYSPLITQLVKSFHIRGVAHITGGGFIDNIPRILPTGVQAMISRKNWDVPQIFRFLQRLGSVNDEEMLHVFNCGIGMVLVAPPEEADDICHTARAKGIEAYLIGTTAIRPKGAPAIVIE